MKPTSIISKTLLWSLLVFTGFFGVQFVRSQLIANENITSAKLPANMAAIDQALKSEQKKPRFVGDIGGMFLAPYDTQVPEEYTTFEDICGDDPELGSHNVSWDEAGELNLDLVLPKKYVLQPDDMNTGAVACNSNGTVYTARRTYKVGSGEVVIGRSLFDYDEISVAVDRPKVEHINGRDVVVIRSLTSDGTFQSSKAWFREPFGDTSISASGVSQVDFAELVAIVASSTR